MLDISQHPGTRYAAEMRQLSAPLRKIGITYVSYIELDHSSKALSALFSNAEWGAHYMSHQYHQTGLLATKSTDQLENSSSIYLMDYIQNPSEDTKKLVQSASEHNIAHVFGIRRSDKNRTRLYIFGAPTHHTHINQKYIKCLPELFSYTEYFNDQLHSNRLLLNDHEQAIRDHHLTLTSAMDNQKTPLTHPTISFNHGPRTLRYYLDPLFPHAYLSHNEMRCLRLYYRGLKSHSISRQLKLHDSETIALLQSIQHKLLQQRSPQHLHAIVSKLHIYNIMQSGII